ncbi:RNA-binding ASCH domain protein [Forsythia ovata]|uniref:RNA-binding ASCH domain protein n=1 Tax=Forsythia ovata TaxID=205694 RepID=A0ABD1UY63_9LAMI
MESPPSPSSPGVSKPQLKDCIEELVKFTLLSSIRGKLNTGLSNDYCANLLKDDPSNPCPTQNNENLTTEVSEGVPSYPLYKRLASSLYQSISSGALCVGHNEIIPVQEDNLLKQKVDEWNKLIVEKGPVLLTLLTKVDFELHVQEPFFSQLSDGLKTIEGRCAVGHYNRIKSGDILLLNKCMMLQVQDIHQYASFHEMLEAESLAKVLPGVENIEEGVQIYRNFYSEEKERLNGVLAICIEKPTSQLYNFMASILLGLSYGGVQRLLGFVQTMGTSSESLPPPPSVLLSSFLLPHNPNVKGSTLTDGARALAKHVNRSSSSYWGTLCGSDSEKNRVAVDVVSCLLNRCCWLNMHTVPPHGVVFEIRIKDGYGARWSADGTKFIGFLEPYMADGHSKGWKH